MGMEQWVVMLVGALAVISAPIAGRREEIAITVYGMALVLVGGLL